MTVNILLSLNFFHLRMSCFSKSHSVIRFFWKADWFNCAVSFTPLSVWRTVFSPTLLYAGLLESNQMSDLKDNFGLTIVL